MELSTVRTAASSMRATSEMINTKVGERHRPTLASSVKDFTTATVCMQMIVSTTKVFSSVLNQMDRGYVSKESRWCDSIRLRIFTSS